MYCACALFGRMTISFSGATLEFIEFLLVTQSFSKVHRSSLLVQVVAFVQLEPWK